MRNEAAFHAAPTGAWRVENMEFAIYMSRLMAPPASRISAKVFQAKDRDQNQALPP